ncbi:MAG: DUF3810 domain-containing protein [Atopobiaceae bacterium]
MQKHSVMRLVCSLVLVGFSGLMHVLVARDPQAFFPEYRTFCRAVAAMLAELLEPVPFAVWDIFLAGFIVVALVWLLVLALRKKSLMRWVSWVVLVVSLNLAGFTLWANNHFAEPLSQDMGLVVSTYSKDELAEATSYYLGRAAQLAPEQQRTDDGSLTVPNFEEVAAKAGKAYEPLGQRWDVFADGSDAPAKKLLVWGRPLLMSGYVGMFWPTMAEAGVPEQCAAADMGFIMCHELAHRLSIASEEEANFAAYAACSESDDSYLKYSGEFNAFSYCISALAQEDSAAAQAVIDSVAATYPEGVQMVLQDREETIAHYDTLETSFQVMGDSVNDTYLKSFGEDSGVHSYGLVVDYLISWQQRG